MESLGGLGLCSGPLPRNSRPLSPPSPLPHPHRVGVCPEPPLGLPGAGPAASCPFIAGIARPHCWFFENLVCPPVSTTQKSPKRPPHLLPLPSAGVAAVLEDSHKAMWARVKASLCCWACLVGPLAHTTITPYARAPVQAPATHRYPPFRGNGLCSLLRGKGRGQAPSPPAGTQRTLPACKISSPSHWL